ncbi:MAG: DUF1934 domain-containing protein [Bacillus sp. (in: firmicutes)]
MSGSRPVTIHLHTTITNGDEKETYELRTTGTIQKKGNALYLRYEEVQEDMQKINATIKWTENEVFIMRSGHVNMRQRFIKDVMTTSVYESPLGALQMLTTAKTLKYTANEASTEGTIKLLYDMNIQGNDVGEYLMEIAYKEEIQP